MKQKVAVVIPAYKDTLDSFEIISLTQLLTVLKNYPIFLIVPEGLNPNYVQNTNIQLIYFNKNRFSDIHSYSDLMCSSELYERFKYFSYILVAQLDTFVFSDRLDYWCDRGYDYIGAPWTFDLYSFFPHLRPFFPFLHRYPSLKKIRPVFDQEYLVGNGGFSLRKVETFLFVLDQFPEKLGAFYDWAKDLQHQGIDTADNEDNFWVFFVPRFFKSFKIPSFSKALSFAFEVNPALCFELNRRRIPFGCHDWAKHDLEFWRPIINKYGFQI